MQHAPADFAAMRRAPVRGEAPTAPPDAQDETATRPALPHNSDDDDDDEVPTHAPPVELGVGDEETGTGVAREQDGDELEDEVAVPATETHRNAEERRVASERNQAAAKKMGAAVPLKDAKAAQRRLMRDLRSLQQTLASPAGESMGLSAHPIDDNIFHWRAIIAGPEGTAWEGGLFKLDLTFPDTYPLEPPNVRFLTKDVFHPNVFVNGNICLDTLKSCWSPTLDVETLLLSITSLLSDPNPRSAANGAAARMLVENKALYDERVRKVVEQSLEQSFSDVDDDDEDGDEAS